MRAELRRRKIRSSRSGTRLIALGRLAAVAAGSVAAAESSESKQLAVDLIARALLSALLRANHRDFTRIDDLSNVFETVEQEGERDSGSL